MFYYLSEWLTPDLAILNLFTYLTVRSGGAAVTAFLISLLAGPAMIRWLRAVKFGQFIRQEHVADLHALHKGKAGTPTMGGALIITSTVFALFLWGRFSNRLLIISVLMLSALGLIGFLDDYLALRKKRNLGLTAKGKFAGQIVIGLALGLYLTFSEPITNGQGHLSLRDVSDWREFTEALSQPSNGAQSHIAALVHDNYVRPSQGAEPALEPNSDSGASTVHTAAAVAEEYNTNREDVLRAVNNALSSPAFYSEESWSGITTDAQAVSELVAGGDDLPAWRRVQINRILMEDVFPSIILPFDPGLHTKLEIPGLKMVLIPLSIGYALFVMVIVVGSSNAVNLTDGLDGLAIGASLVSIMAYTAIAYVVSRADWSSYLFLIHVPEATELTVFGAALLGAGLGFLWFNSHPAEVFMGDTGSLALGGAIGTMAILTKQELLLIVVGGLFVMEAGSVILQVASYKLRKKRIFRMAPLHHHFELLGWSETKVTIRFWILAVLFALMSLATLKLR
ncbi:MAG: hypothetical protein AMXMBFR84_06700 [Candidatus Hydrogenedentota bacterium]